MAEKRDFMKDVRKLLNLQFKRGQELMQIKIVRGLVAAGYDKAAKIAIDTPEIKDPVKFESEGGKIEST